MIYALMFEEKFKALLESLNTSIYKVALSVNEDPSRMTQIVYKRKPVTFEKRLEAIQKLSTSPLLETVGVEVLVAWLAQDYLTKDAILKAAHEVQEEAS